MFEQLVFYLGLYAVSHKKWRRCRETARCDLREKNEMDWEDLTKKIGVDTKVETNTVCLL